MGTPVIKCMTCDLVLDKTWDDSLLLSQHLLEIHQIDLSNVPAIYADRAYGVQFQFRHWNDFTSDDGSVFEWSYRDVTWRISYPRDKEEKGRH